MGTPQGEYMKSPFDHVFSFVPQGHEKALKHALYNAVALFLLIVGISVGYAVCFILQPFIKPLLWAVLCGSVLHPFKHSLATRLRKWFQKLRDSSTPFIVGLSIQPIKLLNKFSDSVGSFLHQYLFVIIIVGIALPFCIAVYHYTPRFLICFIQFLGTYTFLVINWTVGCMSLKLISTVAIAFGVFLMLTPKSVHSGKLSLVSCFLWLAAICYTATEFIIGGSQVWNVAAFLLALTLLLVGLGYEVFEVYTTRQTQGCKISLFNTLRLVVLQENIPDIPDDNKDIAIQEEVEAEENIEPLKDPQVTTTDVVDRPQHKKLAFRKPLTPHSFVSPRGPITLLATSTPLTGFRTKTQASESILVASLAPPEGITSNHCLIAVGWTCVALLICKHMWLLSILPVPILLYYIKFAGSYFGIWEWVGSHTSYAWTNLQSSWKERYSTLLPPPARGLIKLMGKANQMVANALEGSIDLAATIVVICGLVVFVICTSIFIAVQVYAEGVHVVQVAAEVVNNTVMNNPELLQMLPEGIGDAVAQMLDNAYQYGREGISSMIRNMLGSQADPLKAAQLEQQVLELWDRVYQAWVMSSVTAATQSTAEPSVSSEAVFSSWESLVSRLTTTPELLDFGSLTEWLKTNVGMLTTLLETVWSLLKGNISLVFGSITALMSVVLGGGTAILNFVLSLAVFFTALFYLLSSSEALYKPVELITNFSPTNGKRFGGAFEAAVNGVFQASFKMTMFYGLWTWLIHNLFQVKIVYLPSALAALFAAVPFFGTYWACLPAVFELWLSQEHGFEALLLLLCHLLPMFLGVDAIIYSEIRGGGHPYLTGLSVVGGILCLGVEGAIIGPLLLCCLFVAINLSGALMRESPGAEDERVQAITLRTLRSKMLR